MSGIIDIDHLMIGSADPDAAADELARLGFTVTPPSAMPVIGLANRCVLFTPDTPGAANYLEILGHDPQRATPFMRALLAGGDGIKSLVLAADDVAAASARLAAAGAPPSAPVRIERRWALPDGSALDLAFTVATPALAAPPVYCNLCQHHTLQHYLRADWRRHAIGAEALVAVLIEADRPDDVSAWYASLFERTPQVAIEARRVPGAAPRAVGFAIAVRDLAACAALLEERGVAFARGPDRLVLALLGCRIELRPRSARRRAAAAPAHPAP